MKILLVEDDGTSLKMLNGMLTRNGYETLTAGSVDEAIGHLEGGNPVGLIISDIMMPDKDGFELLKYRNTKGSLKKIPVLMCTASGDKASVMRCAALGAGDFLIKPIDRETLLDKVRKALQKRAPMVLVVDDEPMIQEILKVTLEREGINTLTADSALRALEILNEHQVDAVISDIKMPGMNGLDLLVKIKELNSDLPVLLITGLMGKYNKREVIAAGADGFISKPFKNIEIVNNVKKVLNVRKKATQKGTPV